MKKSKILARLLVCAMAVAMPFFYHPQPVQAFSLLGAIVGAVSGGAVAEQAKAQVKAINEDTTKSAEFFNSLKKKEGVNNDVAMNERLAMIMTNVSSGIAAVDPSINEKPYRYFINNDKSFNAYCTIGHNMSVNTGAMTMLTNDDELAVVLGHEMGHGQKNHPVKGIEGKASALIVGGAISGGSNSTVGNVLANVSANQIAASYGKKQEAEADKLAFEYISHTDYNVGACAAVWQRVIDSAGGNNEQSFAGSILNPSDHDDNAKRRDTYNQQMYEYSGKHVKVEDGMVQVNDKDFIKPAATDSMSSAERAYFVAGNLARVYHDNKTLDIATVQGDTVCLNGKAVMTVVSGDGAAADIASKLNAIK